MRIEVTGGREAERGGRFPGSPDINQPMQDVLVGLETHLGRFGRCAAGTAKPLALIAEDRLDCRQQLGRRGDAHADPRAGQYRVQHLQVADNWE